MKALYCIKAVDVIICFNYVAAPQSRSRGKTPITQQEIIALTKEFQEIMEQRFLEGKDVDFNYRSVFESCIA